MPESKETKFRQLAKLSESLDKAHTDEKIGRIVKGSLIRLGDRPVLRVPCIDSGLPTLNYEVLQYGGLPRGRIIEVFGPESSGKTTSTLQFIAQEQKQGGIAAYVDAEHKLEPMYAQDLGVNLDELLFNQPNSGEEALDTVDKLVESGNVSLIVVDSAAALVTEAELAGEIGDAHVGQQARLLSQALRILTGKCARTGTTIIFINQIREKIGVMFGNPETTPGGRALKFYSSIRLSITRGKPITGATKDDIIGHIIDLRCVKNGGGIPFRRTQINLIYPGNGRTPGFDKVNDMLEFGNARSIFDVRGTWYWMDLGNKDEKHKPVGPERVANGFDKFKDFLNTNPKAFDIVGQQIINLIQKETEGNVANTPAVAV